MALTKTVGRIILWALRLGLALLCPLLLLVTSTLLYCYFIDGVIVPDGSVLRALITLVLTAASLPSFLCYDLAFPFKSQQRDSLSMFRWAVGIFTGICLCLIILVWTDWLHSAPITKNNAAGLTVVFVDRNTPDLFFALSLFLGAALLLLCVISIIKNSRQLRSFVYLTALALVAFPLFVIASNFAEKSKPGVLWKIEQTTIVSGEETYFFLREGLTTAGDSGRRRAQSPDVFSAIARRTSGNRFFSKAEIILSDTQSQHPYGALLKGVKHDDPTVRQVSEKLLKEGGG